MGYISAAYDAWTGQKLKDFKPIQKSEDHNFQRKSGTYSVIGMDGGIDPFGYNAMPVDIRSVSVQFREIFHPNGVTDSTHHTGPDAARDSLMLNIGHGLPVRLEYTTDAAAKRYVIAKMREMPLTLSTDSDRFVDFHVTFEMYDPFWSDQFPIGLPIWGNFTWLDGTIWGGTPTNLSANSVTVVRSVSGATAFDLPRFTISGPFGGSAGFTVTNISLQIPTSTGQQNVQFQFLDALLTGESVTIDTASLDVTKTAGNVTSNAFDRLIWPVEQRYLFVVDPRTLDGTGNNQIVIATSGTTATNGGKAVIVVTKRYY